MAKEEIKKKTTTKKETSSKPKITTKKSTGKTNTTKKTTAKKTTSKTSQAKKTTASATKKTTTTKKAAPKKTTTTTKKTTSKATPKKTTTANTKTTTNKSTTKKPTAKKSTSSKKSTSKTTSTPKKKTELEKKTVSKSKNKVDKKEHVKDKITTNKSETFIIDEILDKKKETKIKPEDVVFEEDKKIKESNLSVEDELDKILSEKIKATPEKVVENESVEILEKTEKLDNVILTREEINKELNKIEEPVIKKKHKRQLRNWVYKVLIGLFIVLIVVSLFKIFNWFNNSKDGKELNDELNNKYVTENKDNYDINYSRLKEKNSDTVGYIKINGTDINYVVVKGEDNKYYKNHNFEKNYNLSGWIFMDSRDKLDGTDKNIVIYGNNKSDGSMFGTLSNVLEKDWQKNKENQIITFVSDNFEYRYQVFSTYETNNDDYIKLDFENGVEYVNYIKKIKSNSNYDYKVDVDSYDTILTVTTISGSKKIVLHAKKV